MEEDRRPAAAEDLVVQYVDSPGRPGEYHMSPALVRKLQKAGAKLKVLGYISEVAAARKKAAATSGERVTVGAPQTVKLALATEKAEG